MNIPSANDLAVAFVRHMASTLTAEQLASVVERNESELSEGVCHSHDFCDANMVMLDAWLTLDPQADVGAIAHDPKANTVWHVAWNIAKDADFDLEQVQQDIAARRID